MVAAAALAFSQVQILAINLSGAVAAVVGLTQPEALVDRPLLAARAAQVAQRAPQAPNPQAVAVAQLPATLALAVQARSS